MKKLFGFLLVALFVVSFAIPAFAGESPNLENYVIFGANGGPSGVSLATQIVRVRNGRMTASAKDTSLDIVSGDVLVCDTTSADGITVSKCIVTSPNDTTYFAGVAVTPIMSANTTSIHGYDRNWGYMAIHGYCLAKVETAASSTGEKLILGGATDQGAFQTLLTSGVTWISEDIGTLLTDTAATGLMPVYLK